MTLKFFYNGIKADAGKLEKCSYSDGSLINSPAGTITIYARNYSRFSRAIAEQFEVENNTDTMTDYFENDTIRVQPDHQLYAAVKAALEAQKAHFEKTQAKREQRYAQRRTINCAAMLSRQLEA